MYTRWRLYILAVFLLALAALLLLVRGLRRHGVPMTRFQAALLIVGALLTLETLIVSTLSNFNLGVILPAFFGVPMVAMAFLLPHLTTRFGVFFKWFVAGCYALAAVLLLVCGVLMLSAQHRGKSVRADAVIVLGAAVHGDKVTWVLENRLNTALEFLNAHPDAVCVVSGGQGAGESVTEASAMKKYLLARGIADERVYTEERATDTIGNFRFSKAILDDALGPDARIAFITTDFHCYRAMRVAKAQGIDAVAIAAPDVWYLRLNNFLRESVGICVYTLRGNFAAAA